MPLWALEGDAVMNETEMSSYGRGRQPRFTIEYRALGYESSAGATATSGSAAPSAISFPTTTKWAIRWSPTATTAMGTESGTRPALRRPQRLHADLQHQRRLAQILRHGRGHPLPGRLRRPEPFLGFAAEGHGGTLTPLPEKTTPPTHPVSLNDTTLVALKTDFDRPSRLVAVDSRTGRERRRTWTDSSRAAPQPTDNGWWTEYRRSLLFPERVNSRLVLAPEKNAPQRTETAHVLYPTPIGRSGALGVEYTPDGHYTIVAEDSLRQRPPGPCRASPKCTDWPGTMRPNGSHARHRHRACGSAGSNPARACRLRGAYITLSDLRAADGKLLLRLDRLGPR